MTDAHAHALSYVTDAWDVLPEFPWEGDFDDSVLRHPRTRKWFAVFMSVRPVKLGLTGDTPVEVVNVKCDPDTLATLLGSEGFHPAYHMNKSHWMTILLDGTVPDEMIADLLHISYDLVS